MTVDKDQASDSNSPAAARISVSCDHCGVKLTASPKAEGQKLNCPKCGKSIQIHRVAVNPATPRQRAFAQELAISFDESISVNEMANLISAALDEQQEVRHREFAEIEANEQATLDGIMKERDQDDPRLTVATVGQMVEELSARGLAAFIVTIPWSEVRDNFKTLVGLTFKVVHADDMGEKDVEEIVTSYAATILKRKKASKGPE